MRGSMIPILPIADRQAVALSTFLGVFVPCLCTTFGVVVYLRLGLLVGMAGARLAALILLLSFGIAILTVLSLCALMTSGPIKGGAIYESVRMSIGPDLASSCGVVFYFAYTVNAAFYVLGFAEATRTFIERSVGNSTGAGDSGVFESFDQQVFPWNPAGSWVSTVLASLALGLMQPVVLRGAEFGSKVSLGILCVIMVSLLLSVICLLSATSDPHSGSTSFSMDTFRKNSAPDFTPFGNVENNGFWVMFRVCFPGQDF